MIIEDINEPENGVGSILTSKGISIKRELINFNGIQAGDFTNDNREFLVERKKDLDYMSSVLSDRLFYQWAKMAECFKGPKYCVFVGDWNALLAASAKMSENMYWKVRLSRIRASAYGITWLNLSRDEDLAFFIIDLDSHIKENNNFEGFSNYTYVKPTDDKRIVALAVILGKEATKNLFKEYKSIRNIFNTLIEDPKDILKKVDKLGNTKLNDFIQFYNSEEAITCVRRGKTKDSSKSGKFSSGKQRFLSYRHTYRKRENNKSTGNSG